MEKETQLNQDKSVTIKLSGALSLDQQISFKEGAEIALFLANKNNASLVETTAVQVSPSPIQLKSSSSAMDIIKTSNARTFPQQIVALACYVTQRNKSEVFDPKEVQLLLRRIGNPPQNFGRDLIKATDVFGYLSKEGRGEYIVTERGREMVANGFEGANEGASRRRGTRKSKKKSG